MGSILYLLFISPIEGFFSIIYQIIRLLFLIDGISIILLSVTVNILTLPLYNMAESWQNAERDIQKKMKSKLDDIRAVFFGSERHMIIGTYYKQNNYHPIYSLRSVLGLVIQIPFFIAAYQFLSHLELLKGASYYFIDDLSKPDSLLVIGGITINILPIVMTIINLASAIAYSKKLNLREQLQLFVMAILFLILLYNSPAGLVLYWTMNNVCSLIKNLVYLSSKPFEWFKKIIFALFSFLFVFTILLRIPAVKDIAGLGSKKINETMLLTRHIIFGVIIIFAAALPHFNKTFSGIFNRPIEDLSESPKIRNKIFTLSCFIMFILTGLIIPSSLISTSPQEFSDALGGSVNPVILLKTVSIQAFSIFIFIPTVFYYLFRSRVKFFLTIIMLIITVVSIINVYIFAGDYGIITSHLKFESPDVFSQGIVFTFLNIVVVVTIITISIYLVLKKHYKIITNLLILVLLSVSPIVLINIYKIINGHNDYLKITASQPNVINGKIEPVFKLSKTKKNVLVVMLDMAVNSYFGEIIKNDESIRNTMSGFTWYPNTVSFNSLTRMAIPALYGGYEYTPLEMNRRDDETLVKKHNEALLVMPVLFKNNGYNSTFTDASYANYSTIPDNSIFKEQGIHADILDGKYSRQWLENNKALIPDVYQNVNTSFKNFVIENLIQFSFFRVAPVVLRKNIYDDGYWHNENFKNNMAKLLPPKVIAAYSVLDFLPEITDVDSNSGEFMIIANELTHQPFMLQAPDYIPGKPASENNNFAAKLPFSDDLSIRYYCVNLASFKLLAEWFEFMKQNGVYDNTKIIIASDHGQAVSTTVFKGVPGAHSKFNPLLLVKDFDANGDITTTKEFMTNADVPYIAASHLINPANPFTGKLLSVNTKSEGVKIITGRLWSVSDHGKYKFNFTQDEVISVHDDIFNIDNWNGVTK